jgi:hypothetical protein
VFTTVAGLITVVDGNYCATLFVVFITNIIQIHKYNRKIDPSLWNTQVHRWDHILQIKAMKLNVQQFPFTTVLNT